MAEIAAELERPGDCAVLVLVLDLDRFKVVNDSLGHSAGDQLLISCADRIRLSLRPGDSVCRLGGDEFAILLRAPADHHAAGVVAERLLNLLRKPVIVGDDEVFPSASIGIAVSNRATSWRISSATLTRRCIRRRARVATAGKLSTVRCGRRSSTAFAPRPTFAVR
jgi:diguanylate cyclase (GGDEF)-like protein